MKDTTLFVGMDVHKESISISVLEAERRDARSTVTIVNDPARVRRCFAGLKKEGNVRACYEAGACGYEVHRLLASMSVPCDVVAPALIPVRAGDRVKTDRRDAEKLARLFRAGELASIRVPTEAEESLRDLCRCREDIREDVIRERHRLLKFLLRHGHVFTQGKHWTLAHWAWLRQQRFDEPGAQTVFVEYLARLEGTLARLKALDQELAASAERDPYKIPVARLRCLRGIDTLSAVTLVAEVCDFHRFEQERRRDSRAFCVATSRACRPTSSERESLPTNHGHAAALPTRES
jgi:transposase